MRYKLPAPRYDELDKALTMLKENQAALDAGNAALTTLLEESKAEVAASAVKRDGYGICLAPESSMHSMQLCYLHSQNLNFIS